MENEDLIRKKMEETRTSLTEKLETLEEQVAGTVQGATAAVSDTVETVKDSVEETVSTVKDTVQETVGTVKDTVQEQLAESGALRAIGGANVFDSKTEAIATIHQRLDPEICRNCQARIFRECGGQLVPQLNVPDVTMQVSHA